MLPFTYLTINQQGQAIDTVAKDAQGAFLAGGTNLIDEMKLNIQTPSQLIDINGLPLNQIELTAEGGMRIGAMVRNSDLAWHDEVRQRYPVLSEAILSGASPQLRNMATTAGNLLQRTRCSYYRDISSACNMRKPGAGCDAINGINRMHAVLGTSDQCIATHPSDMCVALAALDAVIHIVGAGGPRDVAINEFYIAYGDDPARLNVLNHGELITHVSLPRMQWARRSHYLKVRDRASYEFALASTAIAMDVRGGIINNVRIALGGVATKPWRAVDAEKTLIGKAPSTDAFVAAAEAAFKDARSRKYNAFKIDLGKSTLIRALGETGQM